MKAIILGSTGLIGSCLLEQILNDEFFTKVDIWLRKAISLQHPKLKESLIDFDNIDALPSSTADIVFCCLGTTIKKAKTKEAFRKVDHDYVLAAAKYAEMAGAKQFFVVSSIGAKATSKNFYLRTKGEMEEAVAKCNIPAIFILRPSILYGKRKEFRFGEAIGKFMMHLWDPFLFGGLKKYRGIYGHRVAKAMLKLAKDEVKGVHLLESDQIRQAAL
jgi:uncharacterized protein YbjT (DUF2867 family)